MLAFVNRSHPYNLSHGAVPFAIFVAALVSRGYQMVNLPHSLMPVAVVCDLGLFLVTEPEFGRYPSCLAVFFRPLATDPTTSATASSPEGLNYGRFRFVSRSLYKRNWLL